MTVGVDSGPYGSESYEAARLGGRSSEENGNVNRNALVRIKLLEEQINSCHNAFGELYEKLRPVLRTSPSSEFLDGSDSDQKPTHSPMSTHLDTLGGLVYRLHHGITETTKQLDL